MSASKKDGILYAYDLLTGLRDEWEDTGAGITVARVKNDVSEVVSHLYKILNNEEE